MLYWVLNIKAQRKEKNKEDWAISKNTQNRRFKNHQEVLVGLTSGLCYSMVDLISSDI